MTDIVDRWWKRFLGWADREAALGQIDAVEEGKPDEWAEWEKIRDDIEKMKGKP